MKRYEGDRTGIDFRFHPAQSHLRKPHLQISCRLLTDMSGQQHKWLAETSAGHFLRSKFPAYKRAEKQKKHIRRKIHAPVLDGGRCAVPAPQKNAFPAKGWLPAPRFGGASAVGAAAPLLWDGRLHGAAGKTSRFGGCPFGEAAKFQGMPAKNSAPMQKGRGCQRGKRAISPIPGQKPVGAPRICCGAGTAVQPCGKRSRQRTPAASCGESCGFAVSQYWITPKMALAIMTD